MQGTTLEAGKKKKDAAGPDSSYCYGNRESDNWVITGRVMPLMKR